MKKAFFTLVLLAFILSSFLYLIHVLPTEKSSLFSGSGNCILCHSASNGVLMSKAGRDVSPIFHWQSSMMGNAAKDPYWLAKVSSEVEENPHLKEIIEDKCATCHAPMGRTEAIHTGHTHYSMDEVKSDALSQDGVSCTVCHQIDPENLSTEESFSGHYLVKPTKTIYGPYESPFTMPMLNNTGYTPVHGTHIASSALCATCHTLITPYVNQAGDVAGYFPEQMPYYEWLNSAYPDQDISCQKCHMPQLNEEMKISSTPPNLQAKRNPIFEHHFVGGNTVVNAMLKDNSAELTVNSEIANLDTSAYYAVTNLKENTIELSSDASIQDNMVWVNVGLKNKTGHKLPTGFPSRRMWIHITVKDKDGLTIFESGKYDENGAILGKADFEEHHDTISEEENVQVYEAVMGNTENEQTSILIEASHYLKDNRIPPLGFKTDQTYDSLIAITGKAIEDLNFNRNEEGVHGTGSDCITYVFPYSGVELSYRVEVCYQSIKPDFVDHLAKSTTVESARFTQMYAAENLQKTLVISYMDKQLSLSNFKDVQTPEWEVFPNPTKGDLFLRGEFDWPIRYFVYTLNGQLISSGKTHKSSISLKDLAQGSYLFRMETSQSNKSFKVVIE